MTLSTGGFRQVVAFPPAPIATGWSDPCREGLAPSQEPCLSTAHDFIITTSGFRFSVHTAVILRLGPYRFPADKTRANRERAVDVPATERA
jgi:hypothetical protein